MRAVLRERAQIQREVVKLQGRIKELAFLHEELAVKRGRLDEIDEALNALSALVADAKSTQPRVITPRATGDGKTQMQRVVEAIGSFGLDEWSLSDVSGKSGVPYANVSTYIRELEAAGRIRKQRRGVYRTIQARVA